MNFPVIPQSVIDIRKALGEDADLHLVGGCVRDFFMGITPKDYDLATVLAPEVVMRLLETAGIPTVATGIRRGTITAVIDHEPFEITTFRQKGQETLFSKTIEEDLSARDFTINAIAVKLADGSIVDPFDGRKHIQEGELLSVGFAGDRFKEDPHRIIRMCRFAALFDFVPGIQELYCASDLQHLLADIEPERINAELKKIFNSLEGETLKKCLFLLSEVSFFKNWIPELDACKGITQNKYHTLDVYEHIIQVVSGCLNYHCKLAALFHDIGKPKTRSEEENGDVHFYEHEDVGAVMTEEILRRLKFSNDDIAKIVQLVKFHMRPIDCGKKAIRKLKVALGDNFENWLELKHADKFFGGTPEKELERWKAQFETFIKNVEEVEIEETVHPTAKLAINGEVVMKLFDLKPCKEVGARLEKCKEYVYEFPEKNTVEDLTGFLIAIECGE